MGGKASTASKNAWNAKAYDRVNLTMPKGRKDIVQAHAEARGESVNGFINRAITETMDREGGANSSDKELIAVTIDHYSDLQRIKKDNGDHDNPALDYALKVTVAKLSSLGVNVEDITLA